MNIDDIKKLKSKIREAQTEAERAEGALQETLQYLQENFECMDIEQAETILQGLEEEEKRIQQKLEQELEKFRAKWGDKLDEYDI